MERAISTIPAVEVWKDIEGFEDLYQVSNFGQVRSLPHPYMSSSKLGKLYTKQCKGRILRQWISDDGYYCVTLSKDGVHEHKRVHRLVAEAFIPNPDNLPYINHKDESRTNNLPSNLEWCTQEYNVNYGTAQDRKTRNYRKPIEQLTLDGKHVAFYPSAHAAARASNGVYRRECIYDVVRGKIKTAYGYRWRYVE